MWKVFCPVGYRVRAQVAVRAAGIVYEGSCLASRIGSSRPEIISKEGDITVKNQKSPTFKRQDLRRKLSNSDSRNYKKMKEGVFSQKSNKKFFCQVGGDSPQCPNAAERSR